MIDACIADGDMVLMEPITDSYAIRNGTIVSAMVPGLGTTLKYFVKKEGKIFLEAGNTAYEPIETLKFILSKCELSKIKLFAKQLIIFLEKRLHLNLIQLVHKLD